MFVNIDVVLSPTEDLEKWYLRSWKEWIIEKQTNLKLEDNYNDIICNYKENEHYSKLDTLTSQLNALRDIGFEDVDCFYKYEIFTMYGGKIVVILFKDLLLPEVFIPKDWKGEELKKEFSKWIKEVKSISKPYWKKIFD